MSWPPLPNPYYSDDAVALYHGDCVEGVAALPGEYSHMVLTDPPYFRVLDDDWDNRKSIAAFLADYRAWGRSWSRVLKPNGTLYAFMSSAMESRLTCLLEDECGFAVLSHIVWTKPTSIQDRGRGGLRAFHSGDNERLVMAEPTDKEAWQSKTLALDITNKQYRLAAKTFAPIREYLESERQDVGLSCAEIDKELGYNGMAGHWFKDNQWSMPTQENYEKLQRLFNGHLRREYDHLRREYDDLRREFTLGPHTAKGRPAGEVWSFPLGDSEHPASKPVAIMSHCIQTSTHPSDIIIDPFCGSGPVPFAAKALGRRCIGFELEERWLEMAAKRCRQGVLL